MDAPKKYQMSISLNVLEHLGINLYSNVPAVLSEVVANSWDADATNVDIEIGKDAITIVDDGHGMELSDINGKFLRVGYKRRAAKADGAAVTTNYGRKVMGRKGIGKLSLLSIAGIVKVETFKDGEQNGFVMSLEEIENHTKQEIENHTKQGKQKFYEPEPLSLSELTLDKNGTRIVLTDLKKQITKAHSNYLRKRLARRFSIIGPENNFTVCVNGSPISITDRDYFNKIQCLWYFGDESEKYIELCRNLEKPEYNEKRDGTIKVTDEDNIKDLTGSVKGWIGTVRKPMELTDTNVDEKKDVNENLNKIVIMVRGKLAQENILDDFRQSGIYTKYLIGEIHADFLDMDNLDDIATTSRQEIIKDNPRYDALRTWIQKELYNIRDKWDEWRYEIVTDEVKQNSAINEWLEELGPEIRKQAESLFRKIGQLQIGEYDDRMLLYKHAALGIENLRNRGALDQLERISVENIPAFMEILSAFDDGEISLYYQMIQDRLKIITKLQEAIDDNAVERTIQEILYDHLWLLDPSWDRATETRSMEKNVRTEFGKLDADLTDEERSGRFDIKYKMTSGKHVIIELKRPSRILDELELIAQVDKYRNALEKLVAETGKNEPVEVICIVGKPLKQWVNPAKEKESREAMEARNIRVIRYQELIENASRNYKAFLEENKEAGRVYRLIKNIKMEEQKVD